MIRRAVIRNKARKDAYKREQIERREIHNRRAEIKAYKRYKEWEQFALNELNN
jgi:hypothetical protein